MSVNAPTTEELVELLLGLFDEAAETRTEDAHPAPEVASALYRDGYPIFGMTPEEFVDVTFDLWERARATEATVARFDPDADAGLRPEYTAAAVELVHEHARADLTFMVANHLGQPAVRIVTTAA